MKSLMHSLMSEWFRAVCVGHGPDLAEAVDRLKLPRERANWGIHWVEIDGTSYQPVPSGDGALIIAVTRPGETETRPELGDLVAWRLRDRRTATRLGQAQVLGEQWLELAKDEGVRLPIFADPMRWLVAGQRGCVIVDWSAVRNLLDGVDAVACQSRSLAQRLHDTTRRMRRQPQIHFAKRSTGHVVH